MDVLLELNHVSKSYEPPGRARSGRARSERVSPGHVRSDVGEALHQVIQDVSLKVSLEETVAIVGPSGSGKTTLLNIMGTLDRPTAGTVRFVGRCTSQLSEKDLSRVRNRDIGFIFQLHHLLPQCTVIENVLLPTLPYSTRSEQNEAVERAYLLLDRVGMEDHRDYRPGQLSVGQRQRAAVVRALINQPKLILADEPTGSLDASTAADLGDLLMELNEEERTTLVVVTHSSVLARRMNRILDLRDGKLTKHR